MPLNMTRIAFGAESAEHLRQRLGANGVGGEVRLTTRYLPKRHAEIVVGGSLFWILKHQLVARSQILRFDDAEGGKTAIVIDTRLVSVHPKPKRAHQGWRYLEDADAPMDLGEGEVAGDAMPGRLAGELARLGLV